MKMCYLCVRSKQYDTVIAQRGLDYNQQGFDQWDLTREMPKAIRPAGSTSP